MPRETNPRSRRGETKSSCAWLLREAAVAILFGLMMCGPSWADWLAERRQDVEQMTPAEKEELNEKFDKFEKLPPEQQEQLRHLHQKLDDDPQGDRLRGVMQRYYDWLKALPDSERTDLLYDPSGQPRPMADRLAKIKSIKKEQADRAAKLGGSHLTPKDVDALSSWVNTYAAAHQAELLKDLPPRHPDFSLADDAGRQKMAQYVAWYRWSREKPPNVSDEEISRLDSLVSLTPRKALDSKTTKNDKADLLHQWLQEIRRVQFAGGGGFGRPGTYNGRKDRKELWQFFALLPKAKQDELLSIADKDEMHQKLRRLYNQSQHRHPGESPTGSSTDSDQHVDKTVPKSSEPSPSKDAEPSAAKAPPAEKQPPAPPDAAAKTPSAGKN